MDFSDCNKILRERLWLWPPLITNHASKDNLWTSDTTQHQQETTYLGAWLNITVYYLQEASEHHQTSFTCLLSAHNNHIINPDWRVVATRSVLSSSAQYSSMPPPDEDGYLETGVALSRAWVSTVQWNVFHKTYPHPAHLQPPAIIETSGLWYWQNNKNVVKSIDR